MSVSWMKGQHVSTNQSRKVYLDLLRIISIGLVIFNHVPGFYLFQSEPRILYVSISVITKIAVPIFFMISGALLLKKNESYCLVIHKRFIPYLIRLICFTGVYYGIRYGILGIEGLTGIAFFKKLIFLIDHKA